MNLKNSNKKEFISWLNEEEQKFQWILLLAGVVKREERVK